MWYKQGMLEGMLTHSWSSFSNYDSNYVHVFAPGSDIVSTVPIAKNSYAYMSGTSMACPMVSGLAAMMMSMRGDVSPAEIKELIELNVQKKAKYMALCKHRRID